MKYLLCIILLCVCCAGWAGDRVDYGDDYVGLEIKMIAHICPYCRSKMFIDSRDPAEKVLCRTCHRWFYITIEKEIKDE